MAGVLIRAAFYIALTAISLSCLRLLLHKYQDADLTLHFYEHFGEEPGKVLKGKVVWITGASSGIGEKLAYDFVKYGSKVILSARRIKELERVKDACIEAGKKKGENFDAADILVLPMDIKDFKTHGKLTEQVLQHFGQIDILLNNAGKFQVSWAKDFPLHADQHVMDVNFMGVVSLTKSVLPHMIERKQGNIGLVNAGYGKFGGPLHTTYSASKFALRGYFDALRLELLGHNIHVSSYMVGPVYTQLIAEAVTDTKKPFKDVYSMPHSKFITPMSPSRCSHLIVTSLVNNLDETWISNQPVLEFYYINQYLPGVFARMSKTGMYQSSVGFAKQAGLPPP